MIRFWSDKMLVTLKEACDILNIKYEMLKSRMLKNKDILPNVMGYKPVALSRSARLYKLDDISNFLEETNERKKKEKFDDSKWNIDFLYKDYEDPIFSNDGMLNSADNLMNSLGCYK